MKSLAWILAVVLFSAGSFMIVKDYQAIGPDTSMLSYTGVILCFLGVTAPFWLTLIEKK